MTTTGLIRVVHWTEIAHEPAYRTPHSMTEEERHRAVQSREADRPGLSRLLDKPCPRPVVLDRLMDLALLRASLTADGASMALTERVSGRYGESRAPSSSLAGDLERLEVRYTLARTNRQRLHAIKATQELGSRMVRVDRASVRGTPEWRERIAADSRPVRVVAREFGVGIGTVSRIRNGR